MKQITYNEIKPYIEKGLISEDVHPEDGDVRIFNYTQRCQFEKLWDDVTMQCRGLIMNIKTGEILARPFKKFYNYGEYVNNNWPIPKEIPIVTKKYDGSLGILYWLDGIPWIATRGAFMSDQAIWATKWFRDRAFFEEYDKDCTYLFEILAFWNRIVVQYKYEGLILLAVNKTNGTEEYDIRDSKWILSKRNTQNDSGEYSITSERKMEDVSGMLERKSEKGLSDAQDKKKRIFKKVGGRKQRESIKRTQNGLRKDERVCGRSKEGALRGLSQDISSVRDGFRSYKGEKVERGIKNKDKGGDIGRGKKVRSSMFKLSQDKDLPHKTISSCETVEFTSIEELEKLDEPNSEGFVILFPKSRTRMKIKFPEYVRLHKLVTGVSEIAIWEHLKEGKTLDDLLDKVPDEFFKWVATVENRLRAEHAKLWGEAMFARELLHGSKTRKEQALEIMKRWKHVSGVIFSLLDGKDKEASESVWKMVRPHGKNNFKNDLDL